MAIRRSSAPQTAALIDDLASSDPVRQEAAVARLTIAGARAVAPLVQAFAGAAPHGQAAILRTLEGLADPRGLPAALGALQSTHLTVVLGGVGAIRPHLQSADGTVATRALDALTEVALDPERGEAVRVAALDALSDLGAEGVAPLREQLRQAGSVRVRRAAGLEGPVSTELEAKAARLEAALTAPDEDTDALRALLGEAGASIGLSTLHELVLLFRRRERATSDAADRLRWEGARVAAHTALAQRGSRLAVFDLRESLEAGGSPHLDELVAAAAVIGDASCLEPLVAVWTRTGDARVRAAIAGATQAIASREQLTRRHAVIKRVLTRFPDAGSIVAPAAGAKHAKPGT